MMTPRLQVIAENVLKKHRMADIGTDHGYLPVYLMEKGWITGAIAADINEKPLQKARGFIEASGLSGRIETRLGSGLSVLKKDEAHTLVMAGMGGHLICDLLAAEPVIAQKAKRLVLQPMNNVDLVRRYLEAQGFKIIQEDLAKEALRVYEIIVAEKGEMTIKNPLDYLIGYEAQARNHPLLKALIERKLALETKIIESTKSKDTQMAKAQYQKSIALVEALTEVKKCL